MDVAAGQGRLMMRVGGTLNDVLEQGPASS
jgi:hypothetical protein